MSRKFARAPVNCEKCGIKIERPHKNQKYCPSCAIEARREWYRENEPRRRERRKELAARAKRIEALSQTKPEKDHKDHNDIGVCNRWARCAYGRESEYMAALHGACRYREVTGHCKVVPAKTGGRTVAPTKNCPFFKPREVTE